MTDPEWGTEFARKYVEACSRWRITPKESYNCKILCAYDVEITDGPFAGFVGSPCGGAENMEGAAAAHVCALYDVSFLEIRAISNLVEDRDRSAWKVEEAFTAVQIAVSRIVRDVDRVMEGP